MNEKYYLIKSCTECYSYDVHCRLEVIECANLDAVAENMVTQRWCLDDDCRVILGRELFIDCLEPFLTPRREARDRREQEEMRVRCEATERQTYERLKAKFETEQEDDSE